MALLLRRLEHLERESPDRRSVYEMTDAELHVSMGLSPNATDDEINAHIHKLSGQMRSVRALVMPEQPDPAVIIERLIADRNRGAKS